VRVISTGRARRWLQRPLPGHVQDDGRLEHIWQLRLWRAIQAGSGSIVGHDVMLGSGRVGARQREVVNMRFGNGVGSSAMSPGSAAWAAARCLLVFVLIALGSPVEGTRVGAHRSGRWRLHRPWPWPPAPLRLATTPSREPTPQSRISSSQRSSLRPHHLEHSGWK
jgi:hypothetical protein